jgi:hypothetical protein
MAPWDSSVTRTGATAIAFFPRRSLASRSHSLKREVGGHQVFSAQYTGEDISENLSLREKLRTDHALILPELPEEQLDVDAYFSAIETIVKERPGFALRRRVFDVPAELHEHVAGARPRVSGLMGCPTHCVTIVSRPQAEH